MRAEAGERHECTHPKSDGFPQAGRKRLILQQPVAKLGHGEPDVEMQLLASLDAETVMMMGDNPALPQMPAQPRLLDFFKLRFGPVTRTHLCQSARLALKAGHPEKVVMACLLHDISNGALIRTDHGYWGAQLVAPYVDEEVSWAVRYHQALRFYPDESVGYGYPEAYVKFFGDRLRAARVHPARVCRGQGSQILHDLAHHLPERHLFVRGRRQRSIPTNSPTSSGAISASRTRAWASTIRRWRTCGAP